MDSAAYHRLVTAAEPIGIRVLIVAVSGLLSSIAGLIVYTVRKGTRGQFVSNASLADGTATLGQRLVVVGIVATFVCFFLMFVGIALMAVASNPVAMLLPTIPGIFLFRFVRDAWRDHQKAKRAFAAGSPGKGVS